MTVKEIAQAAGVSVATVYKRAKQLGRMPTIKEVKNPKNGRPIKYAPPKIHHAAYAYYEARKLIAIYGFIPYADFEIEDSDLSKFIYRDPVNAFLRALECIPAEIIKKSQLEGNRLDELVIKGDFTVSQIAENI